MSYQVQQCWRTFSHLTSECFFLNAAEMKERERLAQKEWIGVAPLRQAQVLKLEVGCSVCQKVELWHWALALASLWWASARVAKKTKKVEWISDSNIWPTKLRMIHPHHFPERNYGLGHGQQPTQVQKWRARSAQGCTGAAYMQFERYRNGSPMVSLECVKWLGHVPIPSHHAG